LTNIQHAGYFIKMLNHSWYHTSVILFPFINSPDYSVQGTTDD